MSTKRSKRHQLIVRVSNMNREYDKNHGIDLQSKFKDIEVVSDDQD